MLERILFSLLAKIIPWLLTKSLDELKKQKDTEKTNNDIDQKLESVKTAYKEALNSDKVTNEHKQKIKDSVHNFIKSDNGGV